jgi:hypothetical protein
MPHDSRVERSVVTTRDGIGCPKHFAVYGKKGYTGGLMAIWCTHSVCLGFHCIPKGEGHNDVFSALFTRWPKAPRYIIYDFACALAPYCWIRELQYFKDTIFLIDDFHSVGHVWCSKACFLSTYAKWNPVLRQINSSAAECGNSSLLRVRKSMRYMSQDRCILFVHRFLAVWNRMQRRKLEKIKGGRREVM